MLKQVFWKDVKVKETIRKASSSFAAIIDDISPSDDHYFYLADYPYGAVIVDHGTFQVPNSNNHIVPLNHPTILQKQKEDLGYSGTLPLGLIIKNCIETFMYGNKRIIPSSLVKVGQFVSLWVISEVVLSEGISYHTGRFWNVTSGARSICMVPKITDTKCHKVIKKTFHLNNNVPQSLFEHWDLFAKIANHKNFTQPWQSTILFFPKQWFEHTKDKKWSEFYRYLLNTVWQSSSFRRNQFIFDFAFSMAQESRNLRPNPYLADIVRHLIAIGNGAVPGFTPAINDSAAPISGLQQVYLEAYGLKKYAPVLLHAHHFSPHDQQVAYYSFQIPTTTIFSPRSRKISSMMSDLQEANHIMELLLSEILLGNLRVENTPLFKLAESVKYGFYHADKDKTGEIQSACEIAKLDSNFTKTLINDDNYIFPEFASFFKGCIAIISQ
jgi:hypothetical protein